MKITRFAIIFLSLAIGHPAYAHAGKFCGNAAGTVNVSEQTVTIKEGDFLTIGDDTKFKIYVNTVQNDSTVPIEMRAQISQEFLACVPGEKPNKTENSADWYWRVTVERVTIRPYNGRALMEIPVICHEQAYLPCEKEKHHHK